MTKLFISEFSDYDREFGWALPVVMLPAIASQGITPTAASLASTAFSNSTRLVRLTAGANCHIEVGTAPVATTNSVRMSEGQTEYFSVKAGSKVAVIAGA